METLHNTPLPEPILNALARIDASHWAPVITELLMNSCGWPNLYHHDEGHPELDDVLSAIEESVPFSDISFAKRLAFVELSRRSVRAGKAIWSVFDGPLELFLASTSIDDLAIPYLDHPSSYIRIQRELLGCMLMINQSST